MLVVIKNKTMGDVKNFFKGKSYKEGELVILTGPFEEGNGITCYLLETYTLNNDRQAIKNDTQRGRITAKPHADGIHVELQQDGLYDPELFEQVVSDLIHQMKQQGFDVQGQLAPKPPDPRIYGWNAVFDWHCEWQKQHGQRMAVVDLTKRMVGYTYGYVRQRKSLYDAEHKITNKN